MMCATAHQSMSYVSLLTRHLSAGASNLASFKPSELPFDIEASRFQRPQPYSARRDLQPQFPAFPTTTIGSFPQTEGAKHTALTKGN